MVRRRTRPRARLPTAPQRRVGRGRPSEAPPGPAPRRASRPTRARRERVVGSSGHAVGRRFDGLGRRPAAARRSRRQPPGRGHLATARRHRHPMGRTRQRGRPTTARRHRHPVGRTRQRGRPTTARRHRHPVGRTRHRGRPTTARRHRGHPMGGTRHRGHPTTARRHGHHAVGRARRGGHAVPSRRRPERGDTALGRHDRVRRGRGATVARRANALGRHQGIQRRRHDGNPVGRCTRRRERRMVDGRSRRHTVGRCRCGRTGRSPELERRAAQRAQRRRAHRPVGWAADQRRPAGER